MRPEESYSRVPDKIGGFPEIRASHTLTQKHNSNNTGGREEGRERENKTKKRGIG